MTLQQEGPALDIRERGNDANGQPLTLDRRLFMQLLVFECERELAPSIALGQLSQALGALSVGSVVYEDVNHPRGLALLTFSENPEDFVQQVRPALLAPALAPLRLRPEFTMLGRTYSTGFEQDLAFWLLQRPQQTVLNEAWPWSIWYPLKRKGGFERLEPRDKGGIMREHGSIGRSYGEADLAHDVRLACHGLDANDNDFVIGLLGKALHPLSHVVQAMRATRQTAEFMEHMGPFFVGRAVWRKPASSLP
ncbi:MAG TPA: chlorite dismutase family protein [Polyangiaceae bacterium]|nr:chlorite dismutase family protein [Polyangiaceae bacterium]